MLERYFKHFLQQQGFPEVSQILYSLGYCQGDGCSFTVEMCESEIKALLPFLYKTDSGNARERVKNLINLNKMNSELNDSINIRISQSGNYVHENTMSTDWESHWGSADESADLYDQLALDVDEYAKDSAKQMANIGYSIIEAINQEENCVWSFSTSRYLFRLFEISEEVDNPVCSLYDQEFFISIAESLIKGESRITSLRAEVFDLTIANVDNIDDDEPTNVIYLGGVEYSPGDKSYGGCRREMISELISDLRNSKNHSQRHAA